MPTSRMAEVGIVTALPLAECGCFEQVSVARVGFIDRSNRVAPSPLVPALYVCHPRPVNGYLLKTR
jgi:hypothetical protein